MPQSQRKSQRKGSPSSQTQSPTTHTHGQDVSEDKAPADFKKKLAPRDKKLVSDLVGIYGMVGAIVYSRNQADGLIILTSAEARATELAELARHNPKLYKLLKGMTQGNAWVAFLVGHGGMMLAIMGNHNLVPQGIAQVPYMMSQFMSQAKDMAASLPTQQQNGHKPEETLSGIDFTNSAFAG